MTSQAPASPPSPIPNNPSDQLNYSSTDSVWDVETPDPITAPEMETRAYPAPATLAHYIHAIQELAGCTVGMAAIAVIGAINLALSNNWDVRSWPRSHAPSRSFSSARLKAVVVSPQLSIWHGSRIGRQTGQSSKFGSPPQTKKTRPQPTIIHP